jgi:L-fuculose-phosphate aldolase
MLDQFIWIGAELFKQGLVDSHGGNMSVKIGDKILITRRNVRLGNIKEGDLIEVPLQGESPEDIQASRELVVHRALYKGTGASAIIHAHPPYAIALSISENKIIPQDAEASFFLRAVPIIKVRGETIGSPDVAKLLPQFLNGNYVVAMVKSHGSYAIGSSLEEAYKHTSVLENSCKVTAILRSMGQAVAKGAVSDHSAPKPMGKPMGGDGRSRAIPPGIGVMDRSSKSYRRGGFK